MKWRKGVYQYDYRRREPVIMAVALCVTDIVYVPFTDKPFPYKKSQFILFMLACDIFVVFFMICCINLLEIRYKEYSELFDLRNVEMRDFTIEFTDLPCDHQYGGKELILLANLWNFVEKQVEDAIMLTAGNSKRQMAELQQEKPWEIMDINFVTTDWSEIDMLIKLDEIDRTRKKKIYDAANLDSIDSANEDILETLEKYNEIKKEFISI
jgi:hypothetical protein